MNQRDELIKFLEQLNKRPRRVLEKLLENGSVSTYELGQLGYDQPPRAAQDLKEAGVSLQTNFGKHPKTGARMAIYSLAPDQNLKLGLKLGRIAFPKKFRQELLVTHKNRCNLCNTKYPSVSLQIDHRIPFIIGGEPESLELDDYQCLCASHQRSKSWECEHCPNRDEKKEDVCRECYWAFPEGDYHHVATILEKRIDLTWRGSEEINDYERMVRIAKSKNVGLPYLIKAFLRSIE